MELVNDKGLLPKHLQSGAVDDLVYPMSAELRPAAMAIAAKLRRRAGRWISCSKTARSAWAFKHADRARGEARRAARGEGVGGGYGAGEGS